MRNSRAVTTVAGYAPGGISVASDLKNIREILDAEATFATQTPRYGRPAGW